jgi:CubicO group peptidase (beta-lactamase class C family)
VSASGRSCRSGIVERLFQGGDRAAFAASGQHPTRPGWSYRSHWWVRHEPRSALAALGVFGQRVHIDPSDDLAVVRFGSHPVASNSETDLVHEQRFAALQPSCVLSVSNNLLFESRGRHNFGQGRTGFCRPETLRAGPPSDRGPVRDA